MRTTSKPGTSSSIFTKTAWMTAVCMVAAVPGWAQNDRSGVSKPQPVTATTDDVYSPSPAPATTTPAKPSAAVPATTYGPYVPYQATGTAANSATTAATGTTKAFDPDANIVTEATAGRSERRVLSAPADAANDPDAGIVTHVPSLPGEIPDGTLIRAKLRETLSTLTTKPGSRFSAELILPLMNEGHVVVPAGSVLNGRVTWMRSGKRISGGAAIHLEPRSVTLPDGTEYSLHARVIDTSSWDNTKVDSEGTIMRRADGKKNAAVMSLTTGGGAAAGAMMAGVPGALIGAGVGAGVSAIVWLKEDKQAELPKDLGLVFSLTLPMNVTPEKAVVIPMRVRTAGGE